MEEEEVIQKALADLRQATGLDLALKSSPAGEAASVADGLRRLALAYREKYNKIHFLQSLLTGRVPSYHVQDRARRLHIDPEEARVLYLMETGSSLDELLLEVLKGLFPARSDTYLIPVSANLEAVLCPLRTKSGVSPEESCFSLARTIVDTMNTEAFTRVRVSYSRSFHSLLDLSSAFQEASLALKVGGLFLSEQTVFPYNRLGIGRLIYRLPGDLCENFLREIFGDEIPEALDAETAVTAAQFFQNNLNIAETARQLHVHRNTLIYRLEQIQHRTGLDLRNFEDAATFKIASMVINYLATERNSAHE